jgi:hypothetical protein
MAWPTPILAKLTVVAPIFFVAQTITLDVLL